MLSPKRRVEISKKAKTARAKQRRHDNKIRKMERDKVMKEMMILVVNKNNTISNQIRDQFIFDQDDITNENAGQVLHDETGYDNTVGGDHMMLHSLYQTYKLEHYSARRQQRTLKIYWLQYLER